MAKKKTLQTPKDDLISSLLNDVQELSDQEAKQNKNASANLFLDDSDKDVIVGLDSDENRVEDTNVGAAHLWHQVKGAVVPGRDGEGSAESPSAVLPVFEDVEENEDSFESLETPAPSDEFQELEPEPELEQPVGFTVVDEAAVKNQAEGFRARGGAYDDKTMNINEVLPQVPEESLSRGVVDSERTVAVEGFANRQPRAKKEVEPRISFGSLRGSGAPVGSVYVSGDASLVQAENLKIAQQRILELEKEVEKYRQENEELASAGEIIRTRSEELTARIFALEGEKQEVADSLQNELIIVKGSLQYKESEVAKARLKIEELEARLKSDFKKIRVRERELENRLELVKAEKSALLRAKDENILDLKRKIDHLETELDNYRRKVLEYNKTITTNQEQFKRTVRALRLALSNLEVKEENVVPLKKAD